MDRAKLFTLSQYPLPQHLISRVIGRVAACTNPWVKNTFIERFIKSYDVNMREALEENPRAYACFNDFFTRELKADARPISEGLVSPADGVLSQFGAIEHGTLVQAKGQAFSLTQLLGGSEERAAPFRNGRFATVYLSPKDYHRVHMPLAGRLTEMTYVPGRLFSVNEATAQHVPGLFARNERLVCIFETEHGPMAMVLVGAMIVAAIKTVWSGQVTPLSGDVEATRFDQLIELARGAEMGRFQLGSTVVMCFPDSIEFDATLTPGQKVSMGQSLGMRPQVHAMPGTDKTAEEDTARNTTPPPQDTPAADEV